MSKSSRQVGDTLCDEERSELIWIVQRTVAGLEGVRRIDFLFSIIAVCWMELAAIGGGERAAAEAISRIYAKMAKQGLQ